MEVYVKIDAAAMYSQKRQYRLKRRAESQQATRRRITESAVELHETLGPAKTSMAAVAARAGVQRSTLYRHFPTEEALFAACSAHWSVTHPPPDLARWSEIADPHERLVEGLTELYRWYRGTGFMLDALLRDEELVPAVKETFSVFHALLSQAHEALLEGRDLRGSKRSRVSAVICLSLKFETWRALCREGGLRDRDASELLATLAPTAPFTSQRG